MRLILFLDTDHLSGPARLALDFSVAARGMGHEILMLGLCRGPRPEPTPFSKAMEAAGIPTRLLHERFRFDPGVLRQFKALIAEFQPDLYQSHGYKGSLLGLKAQRWGVPWQAIFHGFTWENWRVRLYHALDVRWLRRADEVVVVSRPFGRILESRGVSPQRLRWVPNAISEAGLRATRGSENLRRVWLSQAHGQAVLAGVIGRFSPEKAPEIFLEAFNRAARELPELYGVLVGTGPTWETCRRLQQESDVRDRVILAGFHDDLASVYEALDMLIIPSRSEGMPTVLLEAMLMGVPVISTRVGAVPDIVDDSRTGLLVPIGEIEPLARAIGHLSGDGALRQRLAATAQDFARRRLSLEIRTEVLLDHARRLIERKPLPEVARR